MAALRARLGDQYVTERMRAQVDRLILFTGHGRARFHAENIWLLMRAVRLVLRLTGLYGVGQRNATRLTVKCNAAHIQGLPAPLAGLRILQISDLHIDGYPGFGEIVAGALAGQAFDLCLLTGDYRYHTDGAYRHLEAEFAALAPALACPLGVFGILGNHDYIEMVPLLERAGVRTLVNEAAAITTGGARLWLVGLDDVHFYGMHDFNRAQDGIPPGEPRILVVHSPEVIPEASERDYLLYLCGHTHGGQICLPGGWAPLVNTRCPRRYTAGAWQYDRLRGYTSRGAGSAGVFARFFCPPEVVIHELLPA